MNRISRCFDSLREQHRKALVSYLVSGDPYPEATLPTMRAMVEAGVDIIELGVPFSDPMAEGPAIQLGHERALAQGSSLRHTLETVAAFRREDDATPVVLMGYVNPIERMGYQQFAQRAAEAGVDGMIIVDLPPEEAGDLNGELRRVAMENIFLIAPTTTEARSRQVVSLAGGFLYYVSLKGVTGAGHLDVESVRAKLAELRRLTPLPICVGFGIKTADNARAVGQMADGVVVGSLLVEKMGSMADQDSKALARAVASEVAALRAGLDGQ